MSTVATTLLGLILALPTPPILHGAALEAEPAPYEISENRWRMQEGDRVIIDTKTNEGFLFHTDGRYLRFPIVTGQRRFVSYIGRYYNASTPNWHWTAKSMDIKGDRVTFGPSGRFLRLYKDGDRTAYGFHEHRDELEMFEEGAEERFRSMGCIIVQTDTMNLLVNTFLNNGGALDVISKHGIEDLQKVMTAFKDKENVEDGSELALY